MCFLQLSKVGRLSSGLPVLQNKAPVTDFQWSPFNNREIAVGLDTGAVKIWHIQENGEEQEIANPSHVLEGTMT